MSDLRTELMAIYSDHGRISPDLVVTVASEPDHPLHDRFEWDDAIAGPLWRREQAAHMMRSVRISYRSDDHQSEARQFYAVPVSGKRNEYDWQPIDALMADPVKYQLVIREMQREIAALRRRFGHLKEYREAMAQEAQAAA